MKTGNEREKSLLVKILQWFYLLLALGSLSIPFWINKVNYLATLAIPQDFIFGVTLVLAIICALFSLSFFTQNTTLLILSMVLIFFVFISASILLIVGLLNAKPLLSSGIPACSHNLARCSLKEGLTIVSAASLATSIPLLIIDILTLFGAVKAIASGD